MSERAFVALGSNLGERLTNLRRAVTLLGERPGVRVLGSSRVYETDPVGPPQPDYLNAVVSVSTSLSARQLLEALKAIEAELGRQHTDRWGPREIDLDLLLYGDDTIREPGLEVPHTRLHERRFVLEPLADLDPGLEVPGRGRVSALLAELE